MPNDKSIESPTNLLSDTEVTVKHLKDEQK